VGRGEKGVMMPGPPYVTSSAAGPQMQGLRPGADDGYADTVQQLLHAVRMHLGLEVAWTSEFVGSQQFFRFVDADSGAAAPVVGTSRPLSGSFCARVLDGRLPALIPDTRHEPATALLDVAHELRIGAYIGVPLLGADGVVSGMLCATGNSPMPTLGARDVHTLKLLAQLLHDLQVRALAVSSLEQQRRDLLDELDAKIEGVGRWVVLQPIIDARTGIAIAFEGLSRFTGPLTPAQWFDTASRLGRSAELEVAAARSVLALLSTAALPTTACVTVNLSPSTVASADLHSLLSQHDPARIIFELTEHQPVIDYNALRLTLAPWRAQGLRIAIDDAGAGYASLQHVLMCQPDLLKLDIALVRGVDQDPVRRALLSAVVDFAATAHIDVIAEGVETEAERAALLNLGIPYLQGYLFAPTEHDNST
jgi:EAL domain-containing protein (putative c-di-GMP-specific phosphodiesterase class I)